MRIAFVKPRKKERMSKYRMVYAAVKGVDDKNCLSIECDEGYRSKTIADARKLCCSLKDYIRRHGEREIYKVWREENIVYVRTRELK